MSNNYSLSFELEPENARGMAAKRRTNSSDHFNFDQELETAQALIKEFGSGQRGVAKVATQIKIDAAKSEEDKRKRIDVYASLSKGGTVTKRFVDEWSQQAGYRAKSTKESHKFVKEEFCRRFSVFENIERKELRIWVEEQL